LFEKEPILHIVRQTECETYISEISNQLNLFDV